MITIAIVEDHTLFREGLKSLLIRIPDFRITGEFANGQEYCDNLISLEAGIVLMDIEMPVMNGLEATKYIREKLPAPKCYIPVVALTAHNPKIFFDDYKDVGFSQLLTKPYSVKKIMDLLESFSTPSKTPSM